MNKYLLLQLMLIVLILISSQRFGQDVNDYERNPLYKQKNELFDSYKTRQVNIVMFGDSHIAGADWDELLGRKDIVGRGIPSDVTSGMVARLNSVLKLKPKVVFIMGGINDIYNWKSNIEIFRNITTIAERLKSNGVQPIIQSIIYAGKNWAREYIETHNPDMKVEEVNKGRNREAESLNRLLKNYCEKNNFIWIDVNSKLVDKDGFLNSKYTIDELHLNANGYRVWGREVNRVLKKIKF